MTPEQKKLKEAMKILLRDGKDGKLFEAAKARFLEYNTPENIKALASEIEGVDWAENYRRDLEIIGYMVN